MNVRVASKVLGVAALVAALQMAPALAENAPIKIGVIHPFSGPLSTPGIEATNGFTLYFNERGNKIAGREIQLIKEDAAGNPAQGIERARRLVEREQVHMLTGITSSAVAYAVRDYVHENRVPLIIMGSAGANGITAGKGSPYIFRTSFTNRQFNAPFGPYACKKLGYKRVAIMAADFVTGHEQAGAFEETFEKAGCEVVKKIFAPLGTVDFAPFLSQVPTEGIDAVWGMFFGSDGIAFVKQYDQLGLKKRMPLIGSAGLMYEPLFPAMGKSAVGTQVSTWYTVDLPTEANKKFAESYRAQYKNNPGSATVSGYVGAMAIASALEAIDGKVEDKEAFLAALRKVNLPTTPQGPFRFDAKQNVVFDLYVVKIVERDGALVAEPVERIATEVSQDWQPK